MFRKSIINLVYRRVRRVWRRVGSRDIRRVYGQVLVAAVIAIAVGAASLAVKKETEIVNYSGLLDTIAMGESKGNYNAYYGNATNADIDFTIMSVGEVLAWQNDYVAQGHPSSAVGKYQFINATLQGLVSELGVSYDDKFDEVLQDRLAVRLLERRGVHDYVRGKITREQLAHNLSKEWAALPKVIGDNPESSYYDGDGLNKVQISIDEVFVAIANLRRPASS